MGVAFWPFDSSKDVTDAILACKSSDGFSKEVRRLLSNLLGPVDKAKSKMYNLLDESSYRALNTANQRFCGRLADSSDELSPLWKRMDELEEGYRLRLMNTSCMLDR